jgi:hypothetical protein
MCYHKNASGTMKVKKDFVSLSDNILFLEAENKKLRDALYTISTFYTNAAYADIPEDVRFRWVGETIDCVSKAGLIG